jgi:hypothetical protein
MAAMWEWRLRFGLPRAAQITAVQLDRGPVWVYTVVLHQPNPVALEKPYFIGFFVPQLSLAEREDSNPR